MNVTAIPTAEAILAAARPQPGATVTALIAALEQLDAEWAEEPRICTTEAATLRLHDRYWRARLGLTAAIAATAPVDQAEVVMKAARALAELLDAADLTDQGAEGAAVVLARAALDGLHAAA